MPWFKKFPILSILILMSCSSVVKVSSSRIPASEEEALAAWTRTLELFVDDDGHVDLERLSVNKSDLETYLRFISNQRAPHEKDARFSFYLNAYNAIALNLLAEDRPGKHLGKWRRFFIFYWNKMLLEGREISLFDLEREKLRSFRDERMYCAITSNVLSEPKLRRTPWTAKSLDKDLEAACKTYFNDRDHVVVENEAKRVLFSELIKDNRPLFTWRYGGLLKFANRYREVEIPEDAEIKFMPYDWTLRK